MRYLNDVKVAASVMFLAYFRIFWSIGPVLDQVGVSVASGIDYDRVT